MNTSTSNIMVHNSMFLRSDSNSPPVLVREMPYFYPMENGEGQSNQMDVLDYCNSDRRSQDNIQPYCTIYELLKRTLTPPERLSLAATPQSYDQIMEDIEREKAANRRPIVNRRPIQVPTRVASAVPPMSGVAPITPAPTNLPTTRPSVIVVQNPLINRPTYSFQLVPINYTVFNPVFMSGIYNEQIFQHYFNTVNVVRFPPTATANFSPFQPVPPIFTMTPTTAPNQIITNNILPRFAPPIQPSQNQAAEEDEFIDVEN